MRPVKNLIFVLYIYQRSLPFAALALAKMVVLLLPAGNVPNNLISNNLVVADAGRWMPPSPAYYLLAFGCSCRRVIFLLFFKENFSKINNNIFY